ncbi:hypothetical protein GCM10010149_71540 [Nonomuraea roseoviolacea subsp. roseoviolacea]|uniref:Membrane protein YeiB n=1 Tax=Nonomuraea roseoviolacea subsp. carminata TaxID=160689 RepID=A0ABT1K8N0_9ACTN|nr:DUF418 domain-containing protein [Nonomuraea roseoviolacea]MCP2350037.1 putative membrane protein YeiB [Nonomuraea roseoviolacea subsp. carminata]
MTPRIRALDALRGFAVAGIMLVNTWQHAPHKPRTGIDSTIEALFQSRFYPIFSLLFGMSVVLFLRRAGRLRLVARLLWLFCFGLAQHAFYEGEVLTDYAFYGLALLLPASFLSAGPPFLLLAAGVTVWGVWAGGGVLLIPGMFVLGMALMQLRPPARLLPPFFAVSALASALLVLAWATSKSWTTPRDPRVWTVYTVAALTGAAALSTGLLLLLRTRPGARLSGVLEPLGRMALTNYLTGTAVVVLTAPLVHADRTRWSVVAVAALTVAAQALFSRWWLTRHRYGPLEWAWRCLTWFQRVPNGLESGRDHHRAVPDPRLP